MARGRVRTERVAVVATGLGRSERVEAAMVVVARAAAKVVAAKAGAARVAGVRAEARVVAKAAAGKEEAVKGAARAAAMAVVVRAAAREQVRAVAAKVEVPMEVREEVTGEGAAHELVMFLYFSKNHRGTDLGFCFAYTALALRFLVSSLRSVCSRTPRS